MTTGRPDWYDQVIIGGSDVTLPMSIQASSVTLDVAIKSSVMLNVAIQSSAVTLDVNIASQAAALDVAITSSSVTLDVNIASSAVTLNVNANVTNSYIYVRTEATQNLTVDIAAQSVGNVNVNLAASAITLDVNVTNATINVAITSSSVTLDVNISSVTAGVTFDVNISSSAVTLDVNIASSAVTLNVSVTGTASVSIDNATVFLNVQNNSTTGKTKAFDNTANATTLITGYAGYGIYVRNIRGGLFAFKLKVKELSGTTQTLTLCLAIDPHSPALYKISVSVPANLDGTTSTVYPGNVWWRYDTLFAYIESENTNVQLYAETGVWGKYAYRHVSAGFNSIDYGIGILIRSYGSNFDSLPVSGTVNTINIPNRSSAGQTALTTVPAGSEVTLVSVSGTGKLKFVRVYSDWQNMFFRIYVDGVMIQYADSDCTFSPFLTNQDETTNTSRMVYCTKYDTTNNEYVVEWLVELEFQQSFEIRAYNYDTAAHGAQVFYAIYSKLT